MKRDPLFLCLDRSRCPISATEPPAAERHQRPDPLDDLQRSTPVLLSPEREAAIAKAKQTSLERFSCRMCHMYSPSPDERQAFVAEVCRHCQREVREWNQWVAWACEMVQQGAVLLEVEMHLADHAQPFQPISCMVLALTSGTTRRTGVPGPDDALALAELLVQRQTPVLTWDEEGIWPLRDWAEAVTGKVVLFGRMERLAGQLTHSRQGERVVAWSARPYQNGYPADDLAWYCAAYGIEAGLTHVETMRRLVLHLTAQEPLVLEPPEKELMPHARRTA